VTTFQIIIRKFWIRVEKPIWSFIVNCVFWLFHLNKISYVRVLMAELKEKPIETVMQWFVWKEDSLRDWTQWITTMVCSQFRGDCDDAAQLAKWWFKEHGVEAEILNLYSAKEGHTICVTKDRKRMVSNGNVVTLDPATWEQGVMRYFGNKYEVII